MQFAPQSVDKMSQRRNEVTGPNDSSHNIYHSQLSQILSQHQAENTAFMNSQQIGMNSMDHESNNAQELSSGLEMIKNQPNFAMKSLF